MTSEGLLDWRQIAQGVVAGALPLWQIFRMLSLGTWERMVWGWRAWAFQGEKSKEEGWLWCSPPLRDWWDSLPPCVVVLPRAHLGAAADQCGSWTGLLSFYRRNHFHSLKRRF